MHVHPHSASSKQIGNWQGQCGHGPEGAINNYFTLYSVGSTLSLSYDFVGTM